MTRAQGKRLHQRLAGIVPGNGDLIGIPGAVVVDSAVDIRLSHQRQQIRVHGHMDLAAADDIVEIPDGVQDIGNVIENDLGLRELLRPRCDLHLDRIVDSQSGILIKDDFYRTIYPADDQLIRAGAVIHPDSLCAAAPDHDPARYGDIVQGNCTVCRAATDNEITVNVHVLQGHLIHPHQQIPGAVPGIGPFLYDIFLDDVVEDLGKLRPSNVVPGSQLPLLIAVDIIGTHHGPDIGQGPGRDVRTVPEPGEAGLLMILQIQLEGPGHHGHGLLTGDGLVRVHGGGTGAVVGPHVDSHGHILVVPCAGLHVPVVGNVRLLVSTEGAVDDGCHLRPSQVSVGSEEPLVIPSEQAVLHSGTDRVRIPRAAVIIRKIPDGGC